MFRHTFKPCPTDEFHKQRLLAKVIINDDPDACWKWTAAKNDNGYGRIRINDQEYVASRLSFAVHNGADPDALDVCHSCNNPECINPRHLFLGNHLQNMQHASRCGRWDGKGRGVSRNSGEANGQAKLSDAEVAEILAMYATGTITQKELSKQFGVSQGHISSIICKARRATAVSEHREILERRYGI